MKSRFLLSHRFKRIGAYMAPLGFIGWLWAQLDGMVPIVKWLIPSKGEIFTHHGVTENQFWPMVTFMIICFTAFLLGMLFLIFAKEKQEDEYTQRVRLESLQFAALFQFILLFLLIGLVIIMGFVNNKVRMDVIVFEQLPILLILLFWIVYFIRFNWILHFSNLLMKKAKHEK